MSSSSFTTRCREGGRWVTCRYCSYSWCYSGKSDYATCPRCARKTPVYKISIDRVNRLFEEISMQDGERKIFELIRVLLINYIKNNEIKDSIALALSRALIYYTNHKKSRG